jgi:signal transduction histidine kinase
LLNLQAVPLPILVESVIEEYVPIATMTGVTLESSMANNLPPVRIDREIIVQVFSNLLDNALKYTADQGQVKIQARPIQTGSVPLVVCTVADTGEGIADDIKDTIFDKFRRGAQSKKGHRRGAGIGLHYCNLAVQAHGGRIWVESQVGRGSTFYFTLPVHNGPGGES